VFQRWPEDRGISHGSLAIGNLCSAFVMRWSSSALNHRLPFYSPSTVLSNSESFLNTNAHIPESFLQGTFISPVLIFWIFVLGAIVFSMTLTAWCFTNPSNSAKTPNKMLSFTLVVVGFGLDIWAGMSKEEFFLVGMPFSIGTGLVLGSVLVSLRGSVPSVSEMELQQHSNSKK